MNTTLAFELDIMPAAEPTGYRGAPGPPHCFALLFSASAERCYGALMTLPRGHSYWPWPVSQRASKSFHSATTMTLTFIKKFFNYVNCFIHSLFRYMPGAASHCRPKQDI